MQPFLLPPHLNTQAVAGDDRAAIRTVEMGLMELGSLVRQMEADLALFDFALSRLAARSSEHRPDDTSIEWLSIAARDGATAIYKFSEDMEAIGGALNKCPALVALVDHGTRRTATKRFAAHFPDFAGIRHSGQHGAAELYGAGKGEKHLLERGNLHVNNLYNRRLETTFQGKLVSYELDQHALERLGEVRDIYWSAFARASRF